MEGHSKRTGDAPSRLGPLTSHVGPPISRYIPQGLAKASEDTLVMTMFGTRERGATIVEFAVVAPLLFLLLFGVIEFGRGIATYTAASTAAREGARYATAVGESPYTTGIPRYVDCDGIAIAAEAKAVMLDPARTQIEIVYDAGPGSGAPKADCNGLNPPAEDDILSTDRVVVRVSTKFTSPIPLISNIIGELSVNAEQARTIYKGFISG